MLDVKRVQNMASAILGELEHVSNNIEKRDAPSISRRQLNDQEAELELAKYNIQVDIYREIAALRSEPFIAYLKVLSEGKELIFYVCRSNIPRMLEPLIPGADFVNRNAPLGRLASIDVGDEQIVIINGRQYHFNLLEKNLFRPERRECWDAIDNKITYANETLSLESLCHFLATISETEFEDIAAGVVSLEAKELAEFYARVKAKKERIRIILDKMALRDQAILDKNQDEIARLPLDSRVILTGAPGTGKTTLLIKRIAYKTSPDNYSNGELELLKRYTNLHVDNWILFTPNELLKVYLKEAFNKENIVAPDDKLIPWSVKSFSMAREMLGILRVGTSKRGFKSTKFNLLNVSSNNDLVLFANTFTKFYNDYIIAMFYNCIKILSESQTSPQLANAINGIAQNMDGIRFNNTDDKIIWLIEKLTNLKELYEMNKSELDRAIEGDADYIINTIPELLENIKEVLDKHKSDEITGEQSGSGDEYDEEDEETIETSMAQHTDVQARQQIIHTIRWYCENTCRKSKLNPSSLNKDILALLSHNLPTNENITNYGKRLIDLKGIRPLIQGYSIILNRIPNYYQRFRRYSIDNVNNMWFENAQPSNIKEKLISEIETDMLVYVILRNASMIWTKNIRQLNTPSNNSILENVRLEYKSQVLVDEATDFSALQLGAMYYLAHPGIRSITFSGDLMQRITSYGIQKWDDSAFITPDFKTYALENVYRQSEKLIGIAYKLYEKTIGEAPPFKSVYHENESDPNPIKCCSSELPYGIGQWISDRIVEIVKINNKRLPSIAIFVPTEADIDSIYEEINEPLLESSFQVEKCHDGKIADEKRVRIFSIKYIKGLEFEGAFIFNIDKICQEAPDLISKYLYVSLTRAASFLAVTYEREFPKEISFIESSFDKGTWSELIP